MSGTMTQTIRLSPTDNVVVARAALRADTRVEEEALTTLDPIDPGHKVATQACLLYTSPSPRDKRQSRMPSSA